MQQGKDVVAFELLPRIQEVEFDHKAQSGNLGAQRFRQFCRSFRRTASGEQIVHDDDTLPFLDSVFVDLKRVGAVLKRVIEFRSRRRKFSRFADGNKTGVQPVKVRCWWTICELIGTSLSRS